MSPDLSAQTATKPSGRTLIDHLSEYLARPAVAEQMKPVWALAGQVLETCVGMVVMALTIAQRATESCPSRAYAPFLIERGINPVLARGLASLTISMATRRADESRRLPTVAEAIRFLAKPGRRRRPAILRRAEILLAAWEETSIIETMFDDAGLSESEFIGLLESVIQGDKADCPRLAEIAAVLAPHLSLSRGPKITAASAAHEYLLEELVSVTGSRVYTWNDYMGNKGDYSDPLTQATRQEFARPRCSPKSARRRLKRKGAQSTEGWGSARRTGSSTPHPHWFQNRPN
jgi:hypothetical protein